MKLSSLIVLTVASMSFELALAQPATGTPAGDEFAQRASAIVKPMRFSDADKTEHVTALTASYLRQLGQVLAQRQAALDAAGEGATPEIDRQVTDAYRICRDSTLALRDAYVARLNAVMTPQQVERVKDGITGDWLHRTAQVYDEMVPALTYPQRAHIMGLLVEMRENAMMEVDAGRQEKWVDKYRGIINNYLVAQGHDFTALSKAYDAKRQEK